MNISDNVIEEHNNNSVLNPYYVPKYQEDMKKQKAFRSRLAYLRRKKQNADTPKTKKVKRN